MPEATPAIVTLWAALCRPWFLALTLTIAGLPPNDVPDPAVASPWRGFCFNDNDGITSFTRWRLAFVFSVNEARLSVNLTVSFCSGVQVPPFWDLNILNRYGCLEINLEASSVVCPILAV